jgi:hypothetical protein
MIIGWKRHFLSKVSQERPCIILLDELPEKKEIQKCNNRKVCNATCLNGKPCTHKPQTGLEFCKRHLKIYEP